MTVPHVSHLKQPTIFPLVDVSLNLHRVSLSTEAEVATAADA